MDVPTTEAAAREHIAQIRKAKGLDGPESNTSDLEAALIILSEQLYQKSTHFLLELIQNADDNTYAALGPTLNLSYSRQTLRIDCNEIGFGKKNVEAICKIGRSTKVGLANTTRYIGEKGIGFKSVFKVSDVAWITSGHYSFKFDKKETLGMIAPIWEQFPEPPFCGQTSILLQLSKDYDPEELIAEIKSLDPRLLIFLRKLRQVNLMVLEKSEIWRSTLRRHDVPFGNDGDHLIELWNNAECSSLKSIIFPVNRLPPDPKRPGSSQSEILLAFPIAEGGDPWIESQKVYAFLPVRDYGFKFLLQADFLLIASREDIDNSSAWNKKLVEAIPLAFLKAVLQLNKGNQRYTWMRYLPSRRPLSDFFEGLESAILKLLSDVPILENIEGNLTVPSKLRFLPTEFTDNNGWPLLCSNRMTPIYLSQSYLIEDVSDLRRIGVENLSAEEFLEELKFLMLNDQQGFQDRPNFWHSRLSSALSRIIHNDERRKSAVSELEIVPLRDKRWVSPAQKSICLPSPSNILKVPNGIDLHEIHPEAATDHLRQNLFVLLGAASFSKDLVCDSIIQMHENAAFDPSELSNGDLIGHVLFLYRSNWKNTGKHDFWLVTESGSARRGSRIYLDSEEPHSATTLFAGNREAFPFLHKLYSEAFPSTDLDWTTWLIQNIDVAKYPRLTVHSAGSHLNLSKDFQFLLDTRSSQEILLLLRDNWGHYSKWFGPPTSATQKATKSELTKKLSRMPVCCCGGGKVPLDQTILPLRDMVHETMASMSFLDVPEPDDLRWK